MKKILLLLLFIPGYLLAQQPIPIPGPLIIRYRNPTTNDSVKIELKGDSAKISTTQDYFVFNKTIKVNKDTVISWREVRAYLAAHPGVTTTSDLLYWNPSKLAYTPYFTQQNGRFDRSTSTPVHTDSTLNYDGKFSATNITSRNILSAYTSSASVVSFQASGGGNFAGMLGSKPILLINSSASGSGTYNNHLLQIKKDESGSISTTGDLINLVDNPTTTGTTTGSMIKGVVGSTLRIDMNPRVSDGSSAVAYIEDTHNLLSTPGAKLKSIRNYGTEKFSVDKDGNVNIPTGSTYQVNGVPIGGGGATNQAIHDSIYSKFPINTTGKPILIGLGTDNKTEYLKYDSVLSGRLKNGLLKAQGDSTFVPYSFIGDTSLRFVRNSGIISNYNSPGYLMLNGSFIAGSNSSSNNRDAIHGESYSGKGIYGISNTGVGIMSISTSNYASYNSSSLGISGYFNNGFHNGSYIIKLAVFGVQKFSVDSAGNAFKFSNTGAAQDTFSTKAYARSVSGGTSSFTFWTGESATVTRVSNTTFTVAGDKTTQYSRKLIIKWTESSTVRCAMVVSSSYSSPNTTVTIIGDVMTSIDASSLKYTFEEPKVINFVIAGTIGATGTDVAQAYYADEIYRVIGADVAVGTAGTTNSTTFDINKGGTTMFTTKPAVASTASVGVGYTADSSTSLALSDKITVDVDTVSTTAAVDAYIKLFVFPTKYLSLP